MVTTVVYTHTNKVKTYQHSTFNAAKTKVAQLKNKKVVAYSINGGSPLVVDYRKVNG